MSSSILSPLRGTMGRAIVSALVARLPLVMMGLALVLLVRDVGHPYWVVGVVVGAFAVATAAASPLLGRLADRIGPVPVLVVGTVVVASALCVLAAIPQRLGIVGLALVAACAGAFEPPVNAVLRALMPRLASGDALSAAYTLESALQEILFVAGPPLVVVGVSLTSPRATVAVCALILVASCAWFVAEVRDHVAPGRARPQGHALASSAMRLLIVVFALVGVTFGAIDIATVASLDRHGHRDLAGLALGAWAVGSLVSGLLVTRRTRLAPMVRLPGLLAVMAVMTAPLIVAERHPILLGVALFAQGSLIAPTLGTVYELVPEIAGEESLTEAFAWTGSLLVAGFAAGSAAGGVLVGWMTPAAGFALAAAAPAVAVSFARLLKRARAAVGEISDPGTGP